MGKINQIKAVGLFIMLTSLLCGCAAMETSSQYAKLEMSSSLDRPVFLQNPASKTVFIEMDCPVIEWPDIKERVGQGLATKGYSMASNAEMADIIMWVQVRKAGEMEKFTAQQINGKPRPGVGEAIAASAFFSGGNPVSAVRAGVSRVALDPVMNATINTWVYLGVLEVDAYVHIKESNPSDRTQIKESDTRATARARQANLKWEEASGPVQDALVHQIINTLPKK